MLNRIKELAEEAIKLQNKNQMEIALREIVELLLKQAEKPKEIPVSKEGILISNQVVQNTVEVPSKITKPAKGAKNAK